MALTKVIGAGLGTVTEDQVIGGATPTLTIGDAGAEDTKIVFDGNAQDYYIGLDDSADSLVLGYGSTVGSTQILRATTGEISFNDDSADVDFRVESNGNTHAIMVQAGSDCIGIKTASPNDYYADDLVLTAPDEGGMTIVTGTAERAYLAFADGTSGVGRYRGYISYDHNGDTLYLGANGSGQLLIDSTGAVTKPNQPAFLANPSSTLENFATGQTNNVNFAAERFDRNADYNAGGSPSAFTAPVTGVYQLNFHLYILALDTAATYVEFAMVTSNRSYNTIIDPNFASDLGYYHMTMSVLADMDASDTANITVYQQGGTAQLDLATNSTFSGYLVA